MTQREREIWEDDLDPVHRALMALVLECEHDAVEKQIVMGMSIAHLARRYRNHLRIEHVAIPAGTSARRCGCGVLVYWVPSRAMPEYKESVAIGSFDRAPTETRPGEGYPHIADCPCAGLADIERSHSVDRDLLSPAAATVAAA